MQKRTRLWLAKIHARVSLNITPLSFLAYPLWCRGGGELTEYILVFFYVDTSVKKYMYIV